MHYKLIGSLLVLMASIEPAMTGGGEDGVQQVVNWVRSNALRLATSDPRADIDDLRPFAAMVGDARIVSLGESTHGSREHFQLKHRLLRFLVEEKGFTLFGIESGFPACQAINKYVLDGEGEAEDVLAKQTFDFWDTHEVLELVRWMRLYNADPRHVRKLMFYGIDMQEGIRALDGAIHYLEVEDRKSAATIAKRLDPLVRSPIFSSFRKMAAAERIELDEGVLALIDLFDVNKPKGADQARLDAWAIARRHAVVLKQCAEALEAGQAHALPAELGSAFDAYHTSAGRAKALQDDHADATGRWPVHA
jgi:erythromycin esterase